jgi:hypothetical protein
MEEENPTSLPVVETPEKAKRKTNAELQKDVVALAEQTNDITDAVNSLASQAEETNAKLDNVLEVFTRSLNQAVEPMEADLGTEREPMTMGVSDTGDAVAIDKGLYDVDGPEFNDKMKLLAFMEEPVEVMIHQTSEKDADQAFDIQVNGRPQIFVRGGKYIVRRKFVEGLARAKPVHYDNEEYMQETAQGGVRAVRYPSRRGLRYPFTVIEDKNPNGAAWLQRVLAEA